MKETASILLDTIVLYLSPFNAVALDPQAVWGLTVLVVFIVGALLSAALLAAMQPRELGTAAVAGLWLGILSFLVMSGDDGGPGAFGPLMLTYGILVRLLEGAGFGAGFAAIASPFGAVGLALTLFYGLIIAELVDLAALSAFEATVGAIHVLMFFFTLTGIGAFTSRLLDGKPLFFATSYLLMLASVFLLQFVSIADIRESVSTGEPRSELSMNIFFGLYYIGFPLGVLIGLAGRPVEP